MKWVQPPKPRKQPAGHAYEKEAAELRARPGEFAIVNTKILKDHEKDPPRGLAGDIKQGKYIAFRPAGAFYAESHKEWDKELQATVLNTYVMYLGDPE